ncbi:acyltransferase family protein [Janthinobacterium aestuarii]
MASPQSPRTTASSAVSRFEELDGLRGLASFSVFLSHVYLMQKVDIVPASLSGSFLRSLWDGDAAVYLFFILSGFVLALPYFTRERKPIQLLSYLVRRVFRIYPAYLVALLFSLVLMHFVFAKGGLYGLSDWINTFWRGEVSIAEVLRHITMVGPDTNKIDPPVWTLRLELIISAVFPLIIYVLQGKNSRVLCGAVVVAFAAFFFLKPTAFLYFALFITGGILAKLHQALATYLLRLPSTVGALLLACAFFLYSSRFTVQAVGNNETLWHCLVGAGAAFLIILAISYTPFTALLRTRPVQFLGDISYSLYLLHFPILLALSSLIFPATQSLILCAAIALVISVGAAYLSLRFVERPFQALGRRVSNSGMIVAVQETVRTKMARWSVA